jgi:hypothetical protein
MKILLLTDMPPCKNFTAGLVLDQLCRFLTEGSIACFTVVNPVINARISSDLDWIPTSYYAKPRENAFRVLPRLLRNFSSFILEGYNSLLKTKPIASKAISFGRDFGADVVWCILEGQTMTRLARPVSRGLRVPLLTHIWDPPSWWLRDNMVNGLSASLVLKEFGKVMRSSAGCAAASWAMAKEYNKQYGTRTVPIIPSIDKKFALPPAKGIHSNNDLIIGIAGQIYASAEWDALIDSLASTDWKICGRDVTIRLVGRNINLRASGKIRFEFLGWRSQDETIQLLSEADVLYCPYWFDSAFEMEARLSFPSKLTTYLASGRPVFFHGPPYASPARFLEEHGAGACCYSLEPNEILKRFEQLVTDVNLYSEITENYRCELIL